MKKIALITLVVFIMSISHLYSSGIDIGLRGGLNFASVPSSVELENITNRNLTVEALPDSYTGYHLGVVADLSLFGLYVRPELLFTQTGQEMRVTEPITGDNGYMEDYITQEFSHISIPVTVGWSIGPLRLGIGPVGSVLLDETEGNLEEYDINFDYNDVTIGYQAMAGIRFGNLLLDFKYQGNLSDFGDGVTVGGQEFDFDNQPSQYILSLGLLIF